MKIKGFDKNLCCRGMQYEIGKEFKTDAENITANDLCSGNVLHYCDSLQNVNNYYSCTNDDNRYCEIEVLGKEVTDGEKFGSNHIKIIREITGHELKLMKGLERGNTGVFNSGDLNSGDLNSGDRNSGDRNSGDRNSGDLNSGDRNSGDRNSGYRNSGDLNSGYRNSGYRNSGDQNSGYRNSGDLNSGDRNSGYRNSGYRNSGDQNSGDQNSGDLNSGDRNSGDRNSGDLNSGYRNSGVFCNKKREDTVPFFNKESNMTWDEWYNHDAYDVSRRLETTKWIYWDDMTDKEKANNEKAYVCGGYLKVYEYKEAWKNLWDTLDDDEKETFRTLPNFDPDVFEDITGIRIKINNR
jgi:hypothetical protein